ncbi:MAG: NAD(P)/FAD-dependent oxidoreductase [Nitrososphaerota archaeon]|nr:NAD(P)/FAD-dependent oxidoreductase [Nitrososphaerota archaeon]MDG6939794.1 NAD(P)/FAD-dependent oxidoreductase [Nitrososphaerota archaeon]
MAQEEVYDVIVLGGGPVGLFATYYAGFRGMSVKLIEATEDLGGQISLLYPDKYIYDMPGFYESVGSEIVKSLVMQARRYDPAVCLGEKALSVSRLAGQKFEVVTDRGRHFARSIIICTGIGAFTPNKVEAVGIPQFEGKGVFYYVKDPARFKGRKLLIVGGGDTAVDWALHLKDVASSVTLIHRREVFRAHEKSVEALSRSNVTLKLFCVLKEVKGTDWARRAVITNVQTNADEEMDVDDVLVLVGYKADLSIVKQWGLAMDARGILVDDMLETNVPGIFAAGDVASPKAGFRQNLLVVGFGQAATAANRVKKLLDPAASTFEHSTLREPTSKAASPPEATVR